MTRKRKPPVAKTLLQNSISAYLSAIEIHNKPTFKYRYEIVTILIINSWELLLKAFIYKYHKKVKLFYKDGTSKPFAECIKFTTTTLGKDYLPLQYNLELLYDYRNRITHFYHLGLEVLIFSLIAKNVRLYNDFIKKYFNISLSDSSELVLLPIGFKRPFSPIDFISNQSVSSDSPVEVKDFLLKIIIATKHIQNSGMDESIIADFKMNLTNEKRIKNADIIAAVNNKEKQLVNFNLDKKPSAFKLTNEANATPIRLTRNKKESKGVLLHEELSDGILDEINNVVEINEKLRKNRSEFLLGENLYYRIYSERNHVHFDQDIFSILASTSLKKYYSPGLFWISSLSNDQIANLMVNHIKQVKAPFTNSLMRIAVLLGDQGMDWFNNKLDAKYKKVVQKPDYYYTFHKILKRKNVKNLKLRALRITEAKQIHLPISKKNISVKALLEDKIQASNELSNICIKVFEGEKQLKGDARILDFLTYSGIIMDNANEIMKEILKIDR